MATSGFSSTLSLAMVSLPLCSSAISSRTGDTILQGPHHSAQKSTSTGVLDFNTSRSNVASVTAAPLLIPSVRSVLPQPGAPPPPLHVIPLADLQRRAAPAVFLAKVVGYPPARTFRHSQL